MPQCFMGVLIWPPALIVPYFTQQKKSQHVHETNASTAAGRAGLIIPSGSPTSPALGVIQKTVRWRQGLLHRLKAPRGAQP